MKDINWKVRGRLCASMANGNQVLQLAKVWAFHISSIDYEIEPVLSGWVLIFLRFHLSEMISAKEMAFANIELSASNLAEECTKLKKQKN